MSNQYEFVFAKEKFSYFLDYILNEYFVKLEVEMNLANGRRGYYKEEGVYHKDEASSLAEAMFEAETGKSRLTVKEDYGRYDMLAYHIELELLNSKLIGITDIAIFDTKIEQLLDKAEGFAEVG